MSRSRSSWRRTPGGLARLRRPPRWRSSNRDDRGVLRRSRDRSRRDGVVRLRVLLDPAARLGGDGFADVKRAAAKVDRCPAEPAHLASAHGRRRGKPQCGGEHPIGGRRRREDGPNVLDSGRVDLFSTDSWRGCVDGGVRHEPRPLDGLLEGAAKDRMDLVDAARPQTGTTAERSVEVVQGRRLQAPERDIAQGRSDPLIDEPAVLRP